MRSKSFIFVVMLVALQSGPSRADLSHSQSPPSFSQAQQDIIKRNATLAQLVKRDPWLVQRILGTIESTREASHAIRERQMDVRPPRPADSPATDRDPDLQALERSSPEAAHDLFQLIKKATTGRK